jgi:glucose-6-phosphate isomerase
MYFSHRINDGFEKTRTDALLAQLQPALARLQSRRNLEATPLLELPFRSDDIAALETLAAKIRGRYKHVVIAGAGGSGLGGKALCAFAPTHLSPRLHFLENIDPDSIAQTLAQIDAKDTCFIVISKSGSTVETLGHFHVLLEHAKAAIGEAHFAEQFIVITTAAHNPMRATASHYGMPVLDHADNIGGRFSVLTNVGLLPAAIAGLDIRSLRKGAAAIVKMLDAATTPADCESALGAALQYGFMEKGCNVSVMIPYSERLSGFSSWYRQSWAESLGKAGKGTTPIRAVGTTDQHSQLQLYLDGPKDKLFHLITVKRAGTGQCIRLPGPSEFSYLDGKTTGDIMEAQQQATLATLIQHRCPVRHFALEKLDEEHLGALFMHFTLEIIFMAELLGCNPFDQPAVEESKRLSRQHMQGGL